MKKNVLALVLAIVTIISVFSITTVSAYAATQETYPIKEYPHGSIYNKSYHNSYECMAFAKYVSDQYAHRTSFVYVTGDTLDTTDEEDKNIDRSFSNWAGALKELKKLDYGCYVRVHKKGVSDVRKGHSFILLSVSDSGAYVYDANFENDNKVRVHTIDSDEFIRRYDKIQVTMSHKFTKTPVKENTTYHKIACSSSGCKGYKLEKHNSKTVSANISQHKVGCTKCDNYVLKGHDFVYSPKDNTSHTASCPTCGYSGTRPHYAKTTGSNKTCLICGAKGVIVGEGVMKNEDEINSVDYDVN